MTVRDVCDYIAGIAITDYYNSIIHFSDIRYKMYYISFDMVYRGEYYG